MFQEMNEVGSWLHDLYGNNTGFWVGAHDAVALENDGDICWIDASYTAVDASFWLPSEPEHYDYLNDVEKDCVYLNLENDPGLAMENCDEGHLPLCKI